MVLTFARPDAAAPEIASLREMTAGVIADRCAREGGREPSVAEMLPAVQVLMAW